MIQLSNGHRFEYVAASGALGFDGAGWPWEWSLKWVELFDPSLFTVVIKTLTYKPKKGNLRWHNPFRCIRFLPGGVVNAAGLTNPGIKWWRQKIGPKVDRKKIPIVGSILSDNIQELAEMAIILNDFDLVGLEINASCPNTESDWLKNTRKIIKGCQAVKEVSRFPIFLKLSVVHNIKAILPRIKGLVEAIDINSVPWKTAFPNQKSPLFRLSDGGVSGRVAQPFTWKFLREIIELTSIPVIGPSVWEFQDIERLRQIGAKAISFGSVFIQYPWRPTMFVRRDMGR
ncbi:hypothetical protein KKA49_00100 [Patescibacteria group bacterium]|nr:hypothetical protein [Patescibacteria group bacterium]MBU2579968.1 hypothetical protein [Patescibacteria group bacterium]